MAKKLDDLIAENHPVRFRRIINSRDLAKLLGRVAGQCVWCGESLPKPHRRWCSQKCIDEFNRRCAAKHLGAIAERDKGVCAICGRNMTAIRARIIDGRYRAHRNRRHFSYFRFDRMLADARWEADHIVPVVLGGGLCDIDGYRTLCVSCHKGETKYLQVSRFRRPNE